MSSWFDLPASTWGCEESWPKTPSTIVNTTSPCSSVTTLVFPNPEPTAHQPPPRKPPPLFEFIPSTIISKPHEPLQFKHTEGIYKFLFHFQNKLLVKANREHAIQHWYFCHYNNCVYHNNCYAQTSRIAQIDRFLACN